MPRLSPRSMLVVLFSALYALSVSACGRGSVSSPIASALNAPRSAQSIVSAAGNGEAQVQRYIADAGQAGKIARFVTVSTTSAKHIFPPSANMLRSGKALIVLAYSRMYVWPLSAVTITYSAKPDAAVDLTLLPAVSNPKLDHRIAQFEAGVWPIHQKVPAGEQLCGDCVLLLGKPNRSGLPDGWQQLEDPWQQHADYTSWQDPAISAQTTVSAGKSPSSVRVAQDNCTVDGDESTCSAGNYYYTVPGAPPPAPAPTPVQCVISSTTVAAPMTARTTLEAGESTILTSGASGSNAVLSIPPDGGDTWTVTGDGTLSSRAITIAGSTVTFTANDVGSISNATVTVRGSGPGGCTPASIRYTITSPTQPTSSDPTPRSTPTGMLPP